MSISDVLRESSYRDNAQRLKQAIHSSGGVQQAADIIEKAAQTRQPVLAYRRHPRQKLMLSGQPEDTYSQLAALWILVFSKES